MAAATSRTRQVRKIGAKKRKYRKAAYALQTINDTSTILALNTTHDGGTQSNRPFDSRDLFRLRSATEADTTIEMTNITTMIAASTIATLYAGHE